MLDNNVCCVVIWFNPELNDAVHAISSYARQAKKIIVVDNSDQNFEEEHKLSLKEFPNVEYISIGKNIGIAAALNIGCNKAIELGFRYFLTLDQDSCATKEMIKKLWDVAIKLNRGVYKYGIIAAQPNTPQRIPKKYHGLTNMESVIASGNLVCAEAYTKVGGYKENLFIDYVDCWFSLAIRREGYKIVQVNDAILLHNLGNIREKNLLGIKMFPTNHSPLRYYYIARNRLYTREEFKKIFPQYFKWERKNNLKVLIKVILFEKNKIEKIKMMLRGLRDFRKRVDGGYRCT